MYYFLAKNHRVVFEDAFVDLSKSKKSNIVLTADVTLQVFF
jgi:hypothetical protein